MRKSQPTRDGARILRIGPVRQRAEDFVDQMGPNARASGKPKSERSRSPSLRAARSRAASGNIAPRYVSPPHTGTRCRGRRKSACLKLKSVGATFRDNQIASIRCRTLKGKEVVIAGKVTVLCCGGIENARILLMLNGPDAPQPGNASGMVGHYFSDHVISNAVCDVIPTFVAPPLLCLAVEHEPQAAQFCKSAPAARPVRPDRNGRQGTRRAAYRCAAGAARSDRSGGHGVADRGAICRGLCMRSRPDCRRPRTSNACLACCSSTPGRCTRAGCI